MENLIYLLPLLGCAAMMVVMMKMMGGHNDHKNHQQQSTPEHDAEIAALRTEVDQLKREREAQ